MNVRERVIRRDGAACVDCGHAADHLHHVVPRSMLPGRLKPKRDHARNLVCLCWACHLKAHTKDARRRHLFYLRGRYGYNYADAPFAGILREADAQEAG